MVQKSKKNVHMSTALLSITRFTCATTHVYTHSPADQQTADSRACCRMRVTWLIWPYAVDQRAVGGARVFGQCGFVYVAALQLAIAVVMCSVRNARCHAALDDIDIGVHNVVEPGLSCALHTCFVLEDEGARLQVPCNAQRRYSPVFRQSRTCRL